MAPVKQTDKQTEDDKKVKDALDLADKVLALLRNRSTFPTTLNAELESGIKISSALSVSSPVAAKATVFDCLGTELWNGTTNLLRDSDERHGKSQLRQDAPNHATVLLRIFAFHLLDVAYRASPKRTKDIEQRLRNFKLALKTCRLCLEVEELEAALKILEKCSDHVEAAGDGSSLACLTEEQEDEGTARIRSLAVDFLLLRVTHAWKSGRLDLAIYHLRNIDLQNTRGTFASEKSAGLCYEIGKSLLKNGDTNAATEWLNRASLLLDACDAEHLSDDAADLRLSISAKLVMICSTQGQCGYGRAERIVQRLTEDVVVGNRLAVRIMQLDMLHAGRPISLERIQETLLKIVRSSVLTKQTFKIIVQATQRTSKHSVRIACDALDVLIRERLLPNIAGPAEVSDEDHDQLEKACVTLVLFTVNAPADVLNPAIVMAQRVLNAVSRQKAVALSATAIHAMQTLIWKASGSTEPSIMATWLHMLSHPAFDGAGQVNKARIGRKALVVALQNNDLDSAREAYFKMAPAIQNESLTQYLVFKLALRCNDYDMACGSLESLVKHTRDDSKFLYACVLEAQESNVRRVAVIACGALLEKQPPGVHLPTLLRCTARLLVAELESQDVEDIDRVVDENVQVFEKAATNAKILKQVTGERWRAEMQWWSKNAYNLSLRLCGNVHPAHLCRLLTTCITFIDSYSSDDGITRDDDLGRRKMQCHFLAASAFVVLARSGGEGEASTLQNYISCRQHIKDFTKLFEAAQMDEDTSRRMFELLKLDIESILRLQQWDQLNAALRACLDHKSVDRWNTLADLVLIIHSRSSSIDLKGHDNAQIITLIQRIINETWKKDRDLVKVSRWLRLSFSIDLSDGDGTFAFKLLQQAADMARKGYEGSSDHTYPEPELQWLAATAFNKAVDFLGAGEYELTKSWIDGALEVARYAADGGGLHANLTYKKTLAMERVEGAGVI